MLEMVNTWGGETGGEGCAMAAIDLDIPSDLLSLWRPQFDQLDMRLERAGSALAVAAENPRCSCTAWVMPVSPACAVIEHDVVPIRDLPFLEAPRSPYACLCTCSTASVRIMPDCGIGRPPVREAPGPRPADAVYSFLYAYAREARAVLRAGQRYRSRSICLLPGYFKDLAERYPGEGYLFMDAFDGPWGEGASAAIRAALRLLGTRDMRAPGAHLFARGTVDALVAQLAGERAAQGEAARRAGTAEAARTVERVCALVERSLDAHRAVHLGELAEDVYMGRSTLCAAFKREMGESLGSYIQRRRMERAMDLLSEGRRPSDVALAVGYCTPAAFSQAFKRHFGKTPTGFASSIGSTGDRG